MHRTATLPPQMEDYSQPEDFQLGRLSPAALSYVGDSVYELHARERLLWPPQKVNTLSQRVTKLACAEGQCAALARLRAEFVLSDEEEEWLRRGRNASARGPSRVKVQVYRDASALECLFGFLHLTDKPRLNEVCDFLFAPEALCD